MNRRGFIKAGLAAAILLNRRVSPAAAGDSPVSAVRIGIVGLGQRGSYLLSILLKLPGVNVVAVCDLQDASARKAAETVTAHGGRPPAVFSGDPEAYARMLDLPDMDAVVIATPTRWHCPMAVQAMKAGKHVGSEVPAGFLTEELQELVAVKEATGRRYMLLENYAYMRPNMAVLRMVAEGLFGDPYYAECAYIHDCRFMLFKPDGSLDWWGEWAARNYGHDYPTHGLGPVSKWLGLNEGDRMTHCCAMMSRPRVLREYARKKFGPDSPQAAISWANGDFTSVMIRTARGRLIRTDYDVNSPRPMSNYYLLQGTRGVYDSRAGLFFEGDPEQWREADEFLLRYDHPYWRRWGEEAGKTGHGGGDYLVLRDFIEMVRGDREPWIDVYDAASWSVIYHCSRASIDANGAAVEIPDFTRGKWSEPDWRKEHMRPA